MVDAFSVLARLRFGCSGLASHMQVSHRDAAVVDASSVLARLRFICSELANHMQVSLGTRLWLMLFLFLLG